MATCSCGWRYYIISCSFIHQKTHKEHEFLMAVRAGKFSFAELDEIVEKREKSIQEKLESLKVPDAVSSSIVSKLNDWLIDIRYSNFEYLLEDEEGYCFHR